MQYVLHGRYAVEGPTRSGTDNLVVRASLSCTRWHPEFQSITVVGILLGLPNTGLVAISQCPGAQEYKVLHLRKLKE